MSAPIQRFVVFTAILRFRTEEGGPLFSKVKAGEYQQNDKVLYIHDGRLHYDIGSVGVLQAGKDLNDGEWHNVALRSKGGLVQLYVERFMSSQLRAP